MEEKVKIIRYASLNLKTKTDDNQDSATLTWSTRGLYPRITVYTSDKNSFVNNKPNYDFIITAPFDVVTLQMFVNQLKKVCKDSNDTRYTIDCINTKIVNGVRTNEKFIQAKIYIGKDSDGIIYIAVIEDNKKKVKFSLLPNLDFFTFYDKDGSIIKDKGRLSIFYTEAYVKSIETLLINDTLLLSKKEVEVDKPDITRDNRSKPKTYSNEISIESPKQEEPSKESEKEVEELPTSNTDFNVDDFLDNEF